MQEVMDQGKILIANLSKGQIGEDATALLWQHACTLFNLQPSTEPNKVKRLVNHFIYM